jgi:hypothetical protein
MTTASRNNSFNRRVRPLFGGLLLFAALAGCGGGRSGQGGLIPPGAPTAAAQVEGSAAPSSTTAPAASSASVPTLAEQIAALERSGAYPALDRSTDIAGPDANKNGVRDDIEAWISTLAANDAQRKALMQKARALQRTLMVDLKDKTAVQQVGDELSASTECGGDVFSPYDKFSKLAGRIEAMTANTRERAARYLQFSAASSGSVYAQPSGQYCEP